LSQSITELASYSKARQPGNIFLVTMSVCVRFRLSPPVATHSILFTCSLGRPLMQSQVKRVPPSCSGPGAASREYNIYNDNTAALLLLGGTMLSYSGAVYSETL